MNVITLTGKLLDDPARADTGKGIKATFRLDVDGRRRLRIPITAWNQLAGVCAAHLVRGRRVAITGRLDHNEFTARDGRRDQWEVTATAVTFLDGPPSAGTRATSSAELRAVASLSA